MNVDYEAMYQRSLESQLRPNALVAERASERKTEVKMNRAQRRALERGNKRAK